MLPFKILLLSPKSQILAIFSEWRQVKNLPITSIYYLTYNNLVFHHVYPRKPNQICSSGLKGRLLTHNTPSYIEFLNCPPTFWVRPPLKKIWKFQFNSCSSMGMYLLRRIYAYNRITNKNLSWRFELIKFKLKNFVS